MTAAPVPCSTAAATIKEGTPCKPKKVIKRDNKYVLHTYARSRVVLAEGHGMTAADPEGKRYLDFTSGIGVNSLGYCHPAWVQAVCDQAATPAAHLQPVLHGPLRQAG